MKTAEETDLLAVTGTMPLGGSSTFLVNLAWGFRFLKKRLVVVVMAEDNFYRKELAATGVEFSELRRASRIYEDRIRQVRELAGAAQPKAVISCLSPESFEVLRYAPPGVLRIGLLQADDPGVYGLVSTYAPWLDVMVGVSEAICRRISDIPEFAGKRVEYIPYGIQFRYPYDPARRGGPLRVIYAGRVMEHQKRISRIAEVIRQLNASNDERGNPAYEFTIIGSGPEESWLREQIAQYRNVHFLGEMPNEQVQEILSRQDVFLLLSDFEGLPLALLEAMGYGVVPVITDLESGIRNVVTEEVGFRVPLGDIPAAVSALEKLATDRAALTAMAQRCAQIARAHYSAETMASAYLRLLENIPAPHPKWNDAAPMEIPYCIGPRWLYREPFRTLRRWRLKISQLVSGSPLA